MKRRFVIFFGACCLLCTSAANGQTKATDLAIKTQKQGTMSKPTRHKHHDVDVFRIEGSGNQYVVNCYIAHGNELKSIKRYVSEKELMRRVTIKWVNDTTASIHLYNAATGRSSDFMIP